MMKRVRFISGAHEEEVLHNLEHLIRRNVLHSKKPMDGLCRLADALNVPLDQICFGTPGEKKTFEIRWIFTSPTCRIRKR